MPAPPTFPAAANISLMMIAGFFVNGPYALITTAVSADLGTHESLAGELGLVFLLSPFVCQHVFNLHTSSFLMLCGY